jgi:acetyltransferase
MSLHNLDKIFRPANVAVVGASEKQGTIGWALLQNLRKAGYQGKIHPVNPRYRTLDNLPAYPTLSDIHESVDLAVIATPIDTIPRIIQDCGDLNIGGAIIISAGGKEIGPRGKEVEDRIRQAARRSNVRIIGPNCLGVLCAESHLNASFAHHMPLPGKLAFVSQSGAICTAILDFSIKENIGFSYFVSVGSMLDVDFGDMVNYLGNDPEVSSIALYIESLTNFRRFMSAARAVSRVKPIVVLKSGRSPAGARAAASHTGALAGEDAVYDAAFQRAGLVRVQTIEDLFDCAELMAKQPRPAGSGLAIVTNAGGPGVMAADALANHGMEPAALSEQTIERLNGILSPYWSHGNPIDMLGDSNQERYLRTVEVCLTAPEINSLLVIMAPLALIDPTAVAAALVQLLVGRKTSVFTAWMGASDVQEARDIFNRAGIPTYDTPERAVTAFTYMVSYARNLEILREIPPKLLRELTFDQDGAQCLIQDALQRGDHTLTEVESKALFSAYGIPVNPTETATSPEDAVRIAGRMGYPVVMKIHSRKITHKSDAGGVQLDLRNEEEVRRAYAQIMERAAAYDPSADLRGVTLQPMRRHSDVELILGCTRDPDFGPVILFGMGGIMTEILKDRAIALPPLNRLLARRLMESTRVYRLLKGFRNRPPANLDLLEEILIRLSQLVIDFPEIQELDINPMVTAGQEVCALDGRVMVARSRVESPMHLVISPYPGRYEKTCTTRGGVEVFLRPIKPEDAPLLLDLFSGLSRTTIYFRFFSPMRSLSHEMLARFTQIDYDRHVCLVALRREEGREVMLGVARLMADPDVTRAEFAVLVADAWQGKGVGAALLEECLAIARERGITYVWGKVLPENTTMLALGRKLGFKTRRDAETGDYELQINTGKDAEKQDGERSASA